MVLRKLTGEIGRHLDGGGGSTSVGRPVSQRAADRGAGDGDVLDLAGVQVLLELTIGDDGRGTASAAAVREQAECGYHHEARDDQPDRGRKVLLWRRQARFLPAM